MKLNKKLLFVLLITGLAGLGLSKAGLSESTGVNLLIKSSGDVKIKREKWKDFQKATAGALLSPNDRLKLGTNASALVMCSSTEQWQVKGGREFQVSEGCPRGTASRSRAIARAPSRAGNEPIPYVISPRNSVILTNRPLLQWNGVAGTTRYRVQLQGVGLDWKTETGDTQVIYPGEPPLKQGGRYLLIITTDKGVSSNQEVGANLRFGLLPEDKAKAIAAEVTAIKQQRLTPEAEALTLAYLYESYEARAEAIALLTELAQQKSQTRAVYTLLGDLYLQTELNQQAKEAYSQSLTLAQRQGDIEGQAESELGLGEASYGLKKKDEALGWLKKAQASYGVLGDGSQVKLLAERITKIQGSGN